METKVTIQTFETHTEGEPTRIVLNGFEDLRLSGLTVEKKRNLFKENYDWIRELLMKEPRGHENMFGAVIVSPKHEEADIGIFYLENQGYLNMCGHATMGVVSALIESGNLEPKSLFKIETPAGIVKAWPTVENGKVKNVTIQNVDSFQYCEEKINLKTRSEIIEVPVNIVYAGNTIALVNINSINMDLDIKNIDNLIKYGLKIREKLNEKLDLTHKITKEKDRVDMTEFFEYRKEKPDKNIVVFADGSVDRSPCGTGTSAKMTYLYERGELNLNEKYKYESIIGTLFEGKVVDVNETKEAKLISTKITGSAYIIGNHTFYLDPDDPIVGLDI